MLISIIIPCFNEEKVINESYKRLFSALSTLSSEHFFELIFINDGSEDNTREILEKLAFSDNHVKVIHLSRNFGHQPAVSAGINNCKGEVAVIIDADLQDPPEVIPEMLKMHIETGANVVYGVRKHRKGDSSFKRMTAKYFYKLLNNLSEVNIPVDAGDFRLIDRQIIDNFNKLKENNKYIRGLVSWFGFKQLPFYYDREPRFAGETKYPLHKMIQFASVAVFYFSKKPLKLATTLGFVSILFGIVFAAWIIANKFINPQFLITGWTSLIIIIIFFGGVQLLTIGVLGQYIGSLFDEVKGRPEYVIGNKINFD